MASGSCLPECLILRGGEQNLGEQVYWTQVAKCQRPFSDILDRGKYSIFTPQLQVTTCGPHNRFLLCQAIVGDSGLPEFSKSAGPLIPPKLLDHWAGDGNSPSSLCNIEGVLLSPFHLLDVTANSSWMVGKPAD